MRTALSLALLLAAACHTSFAWSVRVRPLSMKYEEGSFNSFRRWPSQAPVSLTAKAQAFFGQTKAELTFDEMREMKAADADVLDEVMQSMPMADQRGERVMLDVEGGQLTWSLLAGRDL